MHVEQTRPVPPLSVEELRRHSEQLIDARNIDRKYLDYIGVLMNSRVWRDALAAVPYDRRLLLLPKCLRLEDRCPAPFDDFGLLCKQCGQCSIQDLQNEAERLGYAVLVAEGSALVMALIQTGKIEAIVGVSCLSVLEKAFPYMESAAIPGIAIPLLQDDCKDTTIDLDWVWDVIHLTSDDKTYRLNLDALRRNGRDVVRAGRARPDRGPGRERHAAASPASGWLVPASGGGRSWPPALFKAMQDDPNGAAAGRSGENCRGRRMFPQGLAGPRRHRGRRCVALRRKNAA